MPRTYSPGMLYGLLQQLARWTATPKLTLLCIRRGIAVQRSGMNTVGATRRLSKGRLVRPLYDASAQPELRRSLSLGIRSCHVCNRNPCAGDQRPDEEASVFCGDSSLSTTPMLALYFTASTDNVLDMMGGEDTTFSRKLSSMVQSKLHSLGTNFHVTSTLILRLFNVECPENAPVAVDVVQRLFDLLRLALVPRKEGIAD
ncbi:hypothetical protein BU15DRAFT_78372 [Melanogaster broomeanus]|nr:hypothetical protein BU15DRAFT_78372 [Melanogaster broomeanus]